MLQQYKFNLSKSKCKVKVIWKVKVTENVRNTILPAWINVPLESVLGVKTQSYQTHNYVCPGTESLRSLKVLLVEDTNTMINNLAPIHNKESDSFHVRHPNDYTSLTILNLLCWWSRLWSKLSTAFIAIQWFNSSHAGVCLK